MKKLSKQIIMLVLSFTMILTGITTVIYPVLADEVPNQIVNGYSVIGKVQDVETSGNKVNITFVTGEKMRITFLSQSIFRLYLAPIGEDFQEYPTPNNASHKATITQDSDANLSDDTIPVLKQEDGKISIKTEALLLEIDNDTSIMSLKKADGTIVWEEAEPLKYKAGNTVQTLKTTMDEYFYGGGTQNGRFSHRGKMINIKNENNWVDQGVASPNPFYWSTKGYGVIRNTFKPGTYDFDSSNENKVVTSHDEKRFDAYYFVGETPVDILNNYYQVTGNPTELPEYASYLGHLNCYNRDYWIEVDQGTSGAVKIGDKYYKESSNDNGGVKETLLGDAPVTAQKIIEEHKDYDMPIGWFLPNDGYGCGYGQTTTQTGDIENLEQFATYARENGVRTGLWTQSNLWPEDPNNPKKGERDIYKEVEAGVDSVKTDVAWVGAGYSMALNGISVAYDAISEKSTSKPNIVTLDGWAGTQRYAGIWTGDQTGGKWEYIRFHIPTYIGTSLSGQPNVGSDMDGIFGGNNPIISTRDFQWKAFTTYMLDMDGWGSNQKSPWALGEDGTSINRAYLKLKAELQPYINTISHEATVEGGLPMMRAMFLEEENNYTYGTATQYQYMWGDSFLIAPIYQNTAADAEGNDIRNNIYLPSTSDIWIDYFTGQQYHGGQVINDFDSPIWKLPVLVKNGAILPRYTENNNPGQITETNTDGLDRSQRIIEAFPYGDTSFTQYEDDGITLGGGSATTTYTSSVDGTKATLNIDKTNGSYTGMVKDRSTEFMVHVSKEPTDVEGYTKVDTKEAYENGTGKIYFYDESPSIFIKDYASEGSKYENTEDIRTPILYIKDTTKMDITNNGLKVVIHGFENDGNLDENIKNDNLTTPTQFEATNITPDSITLGWSEVTDADHYQIQLKGLKEGEEILFGNILEPLYTHIGLQYNTDYTYRVRAINKQGYSEWSDYLTVTTEDDPYRNVPELSATWQYGDSWGKLNNAFDHSVETMFHSTDPVTPDQMLEIDMKKAYKLDYFEYIPRNDNKGNGTVNRMDVYASQDGVHWVKVHDGNQGDEWVYDKNNMENLDVKTIDLTGVTARYLRLSVLSSAGGYFSAAELTPYKVDGDNGHLVGDTNNSGDINENDLVFFENYVGLKEMDNDWEYVNSLGNFNMNTSIDAFDVAFVARQVGDNPVTTIGTDEAGVEGKIMLIPSKTDIKAGDEVTIDIQGIGLKNVYAFNIDFDANLVNATYQNAKPTVLTGLMKNYSMVRTHSDNTTENIVLFSNTGNQELLNTDGSLAKVTLVAKTDFTWDENVSIAMLVGKDLSVIDAKIDETQIPELPETKKVLKPGDGIDTISFSNEVFGAGIEVDGNTLWQQNNWKTLLFDGNTSGAMAEFKWFMDAATFPEEVMLPTDFNIQLDGQRYVTDVTIYGRESSNGALKTSKLQAYNGDEKVFESEINSSSTPTFEINDTITKIVWTPLTSNGTATGVISGTEANRMLSLYEIEIHEDAEVIVTDIQWDDDNPTTINIGEFATFGAKVLPNNATNPFYEVVSEDEGIIKVIKIPTEKGYQYAIQGMREGEVELKAIALGNPEKTITTKVKVESALNIKELEKQMTLANEKILEEQLYTKDSMDYLKPLIQEAQNIVDEPATYSQSDIDAMALKLKVAIAGVKYKGSDDSKPSSTNKISQKQMTVISATNHADNDVKENIIDGKEDTYWHSGYQSQHSLPVDVVVDLGTQYELEQIDYLARQNSHNGHITKYRVEVSTDGESFLPVVVGTLPHDGYQLENRESHKEIKFDTITAQYVKFIALETLGDTVNKYASIAELNFYGKITNEETPVNKLVFEKEELTLGLGEQTCIPVESLPTGAKADITYTSSNEAVATIDSKTGEVYALAEGETTIIATVLNLTRSEIIAEYKLYVNYSVAGELLLQYNELIKEYEKLEINDNNRVIMDEIDTQLQLVHNIIKNPSATEEDYNIAEETLEKIVIYIQAVKDLDSIYGLLSIDISLYDSTTITDFNLAKEAAQNVLDDPLNNINQLKTALTQLQVAYDKLKVLDSSTLESVIKEAEAIVLDDYIDGQEKEDFKTILVAAKNTLAIATTNAEYERATKDLIAVIETLSSKQKATKEQKDKIQKDLDMLIEALEKNIYSDKNKQIIEETINKAKEALKNSNLTKVEAENILSLLNEVLHTNAKEILSSGGDLSVEDTNSDGSKTLIKTSDNTSIWYFTIFTAIAFISFVQIMYKQRKGKE